MATNEISLSILTEINQSVKSLERLQTEAAKSFNKISEASQKSAKAREDSIKKSNDQIAKSFDVIKAGAAAAFAFIAGRAVIGAFNDVIKAASEEQQAIQRLNTSLQLTGKFTEEASLGFIDFADAIEKSTAQTGEAVLEAGALIQSMTRLDTEALKAVTAGAVDLSAVFGKDLTATSRILGKAINGNTAGLRQFGIEIDAGGTKAERLSKITAALAKSQGAAAAQSNTFAGASTQLNNAFEDIGKAFGQLIVDNPAVIAALKIVTGTLRELGNVVTDSNSPVKDFVTLIASSTKLIGFLITPIQVLTLTTTVLTDIFLRFVQVVSSLPGFLGQGFVNQLNEITLGFQKMNLAVLQAGQGFFRFFGQTDISDGLQIAIDQVTDSINKTKASLESPDSNFFLDISAESGKAAESVTRFGGNVVKSLERTRPGITNLVNSFDSLTEGARNAGKSIKVVGDISDDESDAIDVNNKNTLDSYNKITGSIESLAKEVDNKTLTAIDGADQELKRQNELLELARREIDVNVKLTKQEKDRANEQLNNFDKLIKKKNELAKQDAPSQAFEEARAPGKEIGDAIGNAFKGGASEAVNALSGAATGFLDVVSGINGSIGFLQGLVDALPSILNNAAKLFDSITDLPEVLLKSVRNLSRALVRLISDFVPNVLRQLPEIVKELVVAITQAIPEAVLALIAELPSLILSFIDIFTSSDFIERLVVNLITFMPDIVLALIDAFIVKGGAIRIGVAIAQAMIIELPKALANGIAQGIKDLAGGIGGAIAEGFKTAVSNLQIPPPKFPKIELPKLDFKVPDNIRDLFNGKAFVSRVAKAFSDFIDEFKKALTPGKGGFIAQLGDALGRGGGAISQAGENAGRIVGLSSGGTVYAQDGLFVAKGTDRVPAMLTAGETVVSQRDTKRLTAFLDQVDGGSGASSVGLGGSSSEVVSLLKTLIAQSSVDRANKDLTVNIQVGEKQLSQVLLNLNRQGFRVA